MTLSELRYIVAVARERHFGRAAKSCFVSQPTLSVAVKKLEEELGVTLFERGRAEVVTTQKGQEIVEQARQVLESAAQVKKLAAKGDNPLSEPFRIGVIYTIGPYLLPDLIPELRKLAPQMPILVEEGYTADLRGRLKQGNLDAIIVALPFDEPGIVTTPLYDEPSVVLLPISHPWAQLDSIKAEMLTSETVLLLGKGNCFREHVLEVCPNIVRPNGSNNLQNMLEGSSLETIRHMVASGVGVTVLPCTSANADQYSKRMVVIKRFDGPAPERRVVLAWRKGYPRAEAVEVLDRAVKNCPISCVTMLESSHNDELRLP